MSKSDYQRWGFSPITLFWTTIVALIALASVNIYQTNELREISSEQFSVSIYQFNELVKQNHDVIHFTDNYMASVIIVDEDSNKADDYFLTALKYVENTYPETANIMKSEPTKWRKRCTDGKWNCFPKMMLKI